MADSSNTLRFGILGTAWIAQVVSRAMHSAPNVKLVAVASRNESKAAEFAEKIGAPSSFGTYDALLDSDEIDAVYIPLPTKFKTEWAQRAMEKGKHVLIDKPMSCADDVRKLVALARERSLVLMDGTHFVHSLRTAGLARRLSARPRPHADQAHASIGDVRLVNAAFTWEHGNPESAENIRFDHSLEPHGSLGDLGWYCVRFGQTVFGFARRATHVRVRSWLSGQGAEIRSIGEVYFGDDHLLHFDCGMSGVGFRQWAEVVGGLGSIVVPEFVAPTRGSELVVPKDEKFDTTLTYDVKIFATPDANGGLEVKASPQSFTESFSSDDDLTQTAEMVRDFAQAVSSKRSGGKARAWDEEALATQVVLDALVKCARSGGGEADIDASAFDV